MKTSEMELDDGRKDPYIVQQLEKQGRRLVQSQQMGFKSADEAIMRAERDAGRSAGVIAAQQSDDTETGEVLEEPIILTQHGEVPAGVGDNRDLVNHGDPKMILQRDMPDME